MVIKVARAKVRQVVEDRFHAQTTSASFNLRSKRMPTKLFVGGIPYRTSDEELRQVFSQAGEVVSVFIPMDRATQRPRGFAFVEMADEAAAEKAISMFDGSDMGGRRIAVSIARPMEERPARN
jgi:RNA recognition motif-containing protein